jgi:hypothetical protein
MCRLVCSGLALALVACGARSDRSLSPPPPSGSATSASDLSTPGAVSTVPSAEEHIEVVCGDDRPGESRELVTAQEMVFDGMVLRTRLERNPESAFRAGFLDDGLEDPGGPPPDESTLEDPDAGELWPWTTFAVNAWYRDDHGTEISIWTAGLDLEVGDRMLIAGQAFLTAIPEDVDASGMAVVCATPIAGRSSITGTTRPIPANQPVGKPREALRSPSTTNRSTSLDFCGWS